MVVTLIGYRGTGKSTVARDLAAQLGWEAVDADEEIERRAGCTIREIFETDGESGFRERERAVMQELLTGENRVIAAGGGAILNDDTFHQARAAGEVVWLTAAVETILARLDADESTRARRPALTDQDRRVEVESLLAERTPRYRAAATITLATDDRAPAEIAREIAGRLRLAEERGP